MTLQELRQIKKLLADPLERRLRNLAVRGVVKLVNDALKGQVLQVSVREGETRDQVERFQEYGFTSHPAAGAEAVLLRLTPGHAICIATEDRRYRLVNLAPGEVALYDDQGQKVHLKAGGIVEVKALTKIRLDAPTVEATGKVTAGGNVEAGAEVKDQVGTMAAMRTTYNGHTHVENTAPTYTQNAVTQVPAAQM